MKRCPDCKRPYADDLSFCLEDGTPLIAERSGDTTIIYPDDGTFPSSPKPAPTASPNPSATPAAALAPAPAPRSNKSLAAVILGIMGTLLIVLVWGGVKIGIWYLDHNQNTNHNSNGNPSIASNNPSPSPSYSPLSLITGSPSPTPGPFASPSVNPMPDEPQEALLSYGTYEWSGTRAVDEDNQHKAALRMRVTINNDGTYYQRVFLTIPERQIENLLGMEEKGRFKQSGGSLLLSNRQSREINFSTGQFKSWTIPDDGSTSSEKVRNVTENTFQLFDSSENAWFTFSKV